LEILFLSLYGLILLKKSLEKGGVSKMKKICILTVIAAMVLGAYGTSFAAGQTFSIKVAVPASSVSLPATRTILRCIGSQFDANPNANPWETQNCTNVSTTGTLDFGTLTSVLATGVGAGCYYAPNFFIVYLYPVATGGVGYQLTQSFTWTSGSLPSKSLVMTPVYAREDSFDPINPTPQGDMPGLAQLGSRVAATTAGALIYKSEVPGSGRIVRAQYSIPPIPASGLPNDIFDGWTPVPLSQPASTSTAGTLTITIASITS